MATTCYPTHRAKSTTAHDNADWPRKSFIYGTDDGDIAGVRVGIGRYSTPTKSVTVSMPGDAL